MKQTKFTNSELNVEMISYVDDKKKNWFRGKKVTQIHRSRHQEAYRL